MRIAHHTHHQLESVRALVARIEGDLKRVHRISRDIHWRQDGYLVIIRSHRGVRIETDGVGSGFCVCLVVVDHRVARIARIGTFVKVVPAERQVVRRHRCGGRSIIAVKVLRERQLHNGITFRRELSSHPVARIDSATLGTHTNHIARARSEVGQNGRTAGLVAYRSPQCVAIELIFHTPKAFCVTRHPFDRSRISGSTAHIHVRCHTSGVAVARQAEDGVGPIHGRTAAGVTGGCTERIRIFGRIIRV